MGFNPVAFNGASGAPVCYQRCGNGCPDLWAQTFWQNNRFLSRDDLAQLIASAERDIRNFLGVPLCPELRCKTFTFRRQCMVWPHHAAAGDGPAVFLEDLAAAGFDDDRPKRTSYDLGACPAWILPRLAKSVLCTDCAWKLLDQNGDPFVHDMLHCPVTARATCTATGQVEACEVHLYVPGHQQGPTWEIRPLKAVTATYDALSNTTSLIIDVDPWQLINPAKWSQVQINDPDNCDNESPYGVSLFEMSNYLTCVEVVRVYPDKSLPLVEFIWEPRPGCGCASTPSTGSGAGCDLCTPRVCPGCVVQNTRSLPEFVLVAPAVWDATQQQWRPSTGSGSSCPSCWHGEPDAVRIYYWTGYVPTEQCPIDSLCDIDCSELERLIAILAASRIYRPICECSCELSSGNPGVTNRWEQWTRNAAYSDKNVGAYFLTMNQANNEFGPRLGELEVWRQLSLIKSRLCGGYVSSTAI